MILMFLRFLCKSKILNIYKNYNFNEKIYYRQELRIDSKQEIKLWVGILQAKLGHTFLNENHFLKV